MNKTPSDLHLVSAEDAISEAIAQPLSLCNACEATLDAKGEIQHVSGCSVVRQRMNEFQVKMLASKIVTVRHLRKVIFDASPKMRRQVYDMIAPHIVKFKPLEFDKLIKAGRPR